MLRIRNCKAECGFRVFDDFERGHTRSSPLGFVNRHLESVKQSRRAWARPSHGARGGVEGTLTREASIEDRAFLESNVLEPIDAQIISATLK